MTNMIDNNVNNDFDDNFPIIPVIRKSSFFTLAPELMKFIGVTIDETGKTLTGWEDYCVNGTFFSWKRTLETDKRSLEEILDDPSVKDNTIEERFQMIREGKL